MKILFIGGCFHNKYHEVEDSVVFNKQSLQIIKHFIPSLCINEKVTEVSYTEHTYYIEESVIRRKVHYYARDVSISPHESWVLYKDIKGIRVI